MAAFKKHLLISKETARLTREEFLLDRVAWQDLGQIQNLSDYDTVVINLSAVHERAQPTAFKAADIEKIFALQSWAHIIASGGHLFIVGNPDSGFQVPNTARSGLVSPGGPMSMRSASPKLAAFQLVFPLKQLLEIKKDQRPLDYRRINRSLESKFPEIYKYLDKVSDWKYSLAKWRLSSNWNFAIVGQPIGINTLALATTSYSTALAVRYSFTASSIEAGSITLLPPLGKGAAAEDILILNEFFGITTHLPEPNWVRERKVPGQSAIETEIQSGRETLKRLQSAIRDGEDRLLACKRWHRLLYDDGNSLEAIVSEAFELLGASVVKTSKVKDDFRVRVSGFSEGVMEVKGTHNPQFSKGALRQLAGWMDEAVAENNFTVKGIFVGNAARNDEPQTRGKLFEKNNEDYAVIKGMVIVRSMDLFCLSILKQLGLFDAVAFWKEFYECKGALDATKYWELLPKEFQISKSNHQA